MKPKSEEWKSAMKGHPNWNPDPKGCRAKQEALLKSGGIRKICRVCGKEFTATGLRQKYCGGCRVEVRREWSRQGKGRFLRAHGVSGAEYSKQVYRRLTHPEVCVVCGKEFQARRTQKCCSPECSSTSKSNTNSINLAKGVYDTSGHTDIELAMEGALRELGLNPTPQFLLELPSGRKFTLDFAFPDRKVAIECDGDYWHARPGTRYAVNLNAVQRKLVHNDKWKSAVLKGEGWKLLRFWGSDILADPVKCAKEVLIVL